MRRRNLPGWVGLLAVAVIGLAPALAGTVAHAGTAHTGKAHAAASAKRFPANPIKIYQANGDTDLGVAAPNLNAGTAVVEGPGVNFNGYDARNLTWTTTGSYNGAPEGHIQFSNGNYMASTTNCVGVTIKSSSTSDGTLWSTNAFTGFVWTIENPYCDRTFGGGDWELSGLNSVGSQWGMNIDGAFGNYQKVTINGS